MDAELTTASRAAATTAGIGAGLTLLLSGAALWGSVVLAVPAVRSGRLDGVLLAVLVLTPLAAFEAVAGLPAAAQALDRVRRSSARVFEVLDSARPGGRARGPGPVARRAGGAGRHGAARELPGCPAGGPGRDRPRPGPGPAGRGGGPERGGQVDPGRGAPALPSVRGVGDARRGRAGPAARRGRPAVGSDWRRRTRTSSTPPSSRTCGWPGRTRRPRTWPLPSPPPAWTRWVATLPDGLATRVGESGSRISGGQRQRLALARALLADFPVLVLDEPGEHLDTATADALVADLLDATRGRSTVLITHRLAGLAEVDEVLVLDAGRVVERGTHARLLQDGGRYAALWELEQSRQPD